LAIFAGNPSRMSRERVITEPPPERVLMNPTKIPATIKTMIVITDIISLLSHRVTEYQNPIPHPHIQHPASSINF
jgi:hypothetical protein